MNQSGAERFVEHAKAILSRIDIYERSTDEGIPQNGLQVAKREIEKMISIVKSQSIPPVQERYRTLSRMILDQWPLGHKLGAAISELEEEYRKLPA